MAVIATIMPRSFRGRNGCGALRAGQAPGSRTDVWSLLRSGAQGRNAKSSPIKRLLNDWTLRFPTTFQRQFGRVSNRMAGHAGIGCSGTRRQSKCGWFSAENIFKPPL